jgi:hypothetical protein
LPFRVRVRVGGRWRGSETREKNERQPSLGFAGGGEIPKLRVGNGGVAAEKLVLSS